MGIIIVSLLVAGIISILLFLGTVGILAVSPVDFWEDPVGILQTAGEMEADTAQLHVSLLLTTLAMLAVMAFAIFVVNIVKKGDYKYKDLLENIFSVCFYIAFLVFLGNGLYYVYHLFIKFNTLF